MLSPVIEPANGQWKRIKDLLPGQIGQPGATARDNWLFIDAVHGSGVEGAWLSGQQLARQLPSSW